MVTRSVPPSTRTDRYQRHRSGRLLGRCAHMAGMTAVDPPSPRALDLTPWLSVRDIATICAVSTKTVHEWRRTGRGPRFHLLGKHLRCAPADLHAWLDSCVADGTSGQAPPVDDGWDD